MRFSTFAPAEKRRRRGRVLARLGAAVAFSALVAAPLAAQNGTITGTVTEASTMRPMSSAQVYLANTSLGTLTNQSGRYLILNDPPGTYTVTVERIGYGTATQEVTGARPSRPTSVWSPRPWGSTRSSSRAPPVPPAEERWATPSAR